MNGVERAAARLAAKRKANESIPDTQIVTRQQRRAMKRQGDKGILTAKVHGRKEGTTESYARGV